VLRIQAILMRIRIRPLKKPDPDPALCKILKKEIFASKWPIRGLIYELPDPHLLPKFQIRPNDADNEISHDNFDNSMKFKEMLNT
jgi:hypothetical protein